MGADDQDGTRIGSKAREDISVALAIDCERLILYAGTDEAELRMHVRCSGFQCLAMIEAARVELLRQNPYVFAKSGGVNSWRCRKLPE
ncbi:MAG: hypothetical protein ABL878_03735 [Burkholderiales bacterium]